jgi:hypothetical protein
VALPTDCEILHVLPQDFVVDEQDGIREPVGITGVRLEARVHIVTGSIGSGQNLIKCCNRAGLRVQDVLGGPLAASDAVLTPEEKELGVALIDIGPARPKPSSCTPGRSATRCSSRWQAPHQRPRRGLAHAVLGSRALKKRHGSAWAMAPAA